GPAGHGTARHGSGHHRPDARRAAEHLEHQAGIIEGLVAAVPSHHSKARFVVKILLAIDGSDCSKAAVHRVGGYGWPPDAHVRIITVDPPLGDSLVGAATGLSAYDELVRRQREEANANLVEAVA